MFLASGPIVLMPSAIALFTKNRYRVGIVGVNILVWLGLYSLLQEVVVGGTRVGVAIPVPVEVAIWLILLRVAISEDTMQSAEQQSVPENGPSNHDQATHETRAPDA